MILRDVLFNTASLHPKKIAIAFKDERIDFRTLQEMVKNLSFNLQSYGLSKGHKVAILLPNCPQFVISYFAILDFGGIAVPLDTRISAEELRRILEDSEAKALIISEKSYDALAHLLSQLGIKMIIVGRRGDLPSFQDMCEKGGRIGEEMILRGDDEALYLYTSGTTGRPKGVILTFDHLDCFPETMEEAVGTSSEDVWACLLPMSHIVGPICCNEMIFRGSTLAIFDSIRPQDIMNGIDRYKVTICISVPTVFQLWLNEDRKGYDLSSLYCVAMMGMKVPLYVMEEFSRCFPHVAVIQGYGLTETSPIITVTPLKEWRERMDSVGKAVPRIEIKIFDDNDNELAIGEIGEVVVRGPHVMKGYHHQPEATQEVIRNGWFHTGDMGYLDKDGYLYLVGRKGEMIITGGLNVYPGEVENVLIQHPKVKEAAVVGVQDRLRGEIVKAVIVPRGKIDEREVMSFCRQKLASFKVPSIIEFRDSIPKTSTGKPKKEEL